MSDQPKIIRAINSDQYYELRRWMEEDLAGVNQLDCTMEEYAKKASQALGFVVSASSVTRACKAMEVWPSMVSKTRMFQDQLDALKARLAKLETAVYTDSKRPYRDNTDIL